MAASHGNHFSESHSLFYITFCPLPSCWPVLCFSIFSVAVTSQTLKLTKELAKEKEKLCSRMLHI